METALKGLKVDNKQVKKFGNVAGANCHKEKSGWVSGERDGGLFR